MSAAQGNGTRTRRAWTAAAQLRGRARAATSVWTCVRAPVWTAVWTAILATAACAALHPAPVRADSVFGLVYFGGDARLSDARAEGRGGTGLAFRDSLNANITLPTQLVDVRRVTVSLASQWARRDSREDAASITRYDLMSPTLRVALPLGRHLGFGSGFQARRTTQWTVVRPNASNPTIIERIQREGTQFEVPLELGVGVNRHVRLGMGVLLERGTIRESYTADLAGTDLIDPTDVREDVFTATASEIALAVYDLRGLSLGGYFVPQRTANVDVQRRGVALDARENSTRKDRLPPRWGVGARASVGAAWSIGADLEQELWSHYRGRPSYEGSLQDESVARVGLEREEAARGGPLALRAGAYVRRWNYSLQGHRVQEWGITVGTAIRMLGGGSRGDIALGYSEVGSLQENGVREKIWRLAFSLTGSEKWF